MSSGPPKRTCTDGKYIYTINYAVIRSFIRNEQKKAKRVRREAEKDYMGALQSLGNEVGEYVGDGQGDVETESSTPPVEVVDADSDVDDTSIEQDGGDSSDGAQPLLVLYDCETTGFSIYNDHIIEIAAEIVDCPLPYNNISFSSLVKTSRQIKAEGIETKIKNKIINFFQC